MAKLVDDKAKQFAIEQSKRIKQDYEDFMFPNKTVSSQARMNIWGRIFKSEIKKQGTTKDIFNNLQHITSDTASIYNQVVDTPINLGKIEKQKYQLGFRFFDLEEILAIDPNKIEAYSGKNWFRNECFVELGDYSVLQVSSLDKGKELANRIKNEVETIQNSINRKELNPYFKALYGKDIPCFLPIVNCQRDIKSIAITVINNRDSGEQE